MSKFVEVHDESVQDAALELCKGSYQRDVVLGYESLSGSTLKGGARNWGLKYARSRESLLRRIKLAGLPVHEETQDHGRRVLVFGTPLPVIPSEYDVLFGSACERLCCG